jgi:hypothetical protein
LIVRRSVAFTTPKTQLKCPFRNFLNRLLGFKRGDLIRGGVTDVDA